MNGAVVMATLRDVATRAGLTVIATLHHVDYARRYADRILGLRDGRLVFDGAPEALTDPALVEIFGELPESSLPAPLFAPSAPAWLPAVTS
jgi:phosphonate transport system ATP-binding protein